MESKHRRPRYSSLLAVVAILSTAGFDSVGAFSEGKAQPRFRALVVTFSGPLSVFEHDSIPDARAMVESLAEEYNFEVTIEEDNLEDLNPDTLVNYQVVIFANVCPWNYDYISETQVPYMSSSQQQALRTFIASGGGYVGIHCGSALGLSDQVVLGGGQYGDDHWFSDLLGGMAFQFHVDPSQARADVVRVDAFHPSTSFLEWRGERRNILDDHYTFASLEPDRIRILLSVDEESFDCRDSTRPGPSNPRCMEPVHPVSWCVNNVLGSGRSWLTALGHLKSSEGGLYDDAEFRLHVLGGIEYAALGEGDCVHNNPALSGPNAPSSLSTALRD